MNHLHLPVPGSELIDTVGSARPARFERFGILVFCLVAAVVLLVGRSFYLQIIRGSSFLSIAEGNRVAALPLEAPRGIIYDRYQKQLVENRASTNVIVDPTLLSDDTFRQEAVLGKVAAELGMKRERLAALIEEARSKQRATVLVRAIPHSSRLALEELLAEVPAIQLVSASVRSFPLAHATSHLIGYTNSVTAEELAANATLYPTDTTGKTGLEQRYDQLLRGSAGAAYTEINAAGKPLTDLGQKPPVPGADLYLTIDSELQQFIYSVLAERQGKEKPTSGAVIALDPRTGAVVALVSYPAFDPNTFSQPALRDATTNTFSDPAQPLFNRAVDGTFSPGSTIKPLLAAAALEENIITPETLIVSTGGITVGPWHFPDWKSGGHGVTTVTKAIAESVNTFFYLIAGGSDTQPGLGIKRITEYLRYFGLGQVTGLDLPSEASGFLPTPEWKKSVKHEPWYIGDTYHIGIGQGDVLVTPLQLTRAIAAIANRGTLYQPYIVEKVLANDAVIRSHTLSKISLPLSAATLYVVRDGMRQTVTSGSAQSLSNLPIALAGKTGTAQIGGTSDTHAWFTSFGPYEAPELTLTILLERGGQGDLDAVPVAREIWNWWIQHRYH